MSVSVRDYLTAELTPLLPSTWKIIANQRVPETFDTVAVILKHLHIETLAEAPIGSLRNRVLITIADPHTDQVRAENALDEAVLELCTALDGHSRIIWTGADKVLVTDTYLGWDITVEVITEKE